MEEGGVALLPELLVLLALHASHPLHHLFAQLHGWGQRFGVSTQNVAKVDVEQLPWMRRRENILKPLLKIGAISKSVSYKPSASPVFVRSRLSRCLSPTPRMYVMTQ